MSAKRPWGKRRAKRHACRQAAAILQSHMDAGSEFEVPEAFDEGREDLDAVYRAMEELVNELSRRGGL